MNQDIKQRWVAALRSGEYKQGTNWLCKNGEFCCLGVLSDLAVKDGVISARPSEWDEATTYFDNEPALLPEAVAEWAGLPCAEDGPLEDPVVQVGGVEKGLSELNDEGMTFTELADIIEEKL